MQYTLNEVAATNDTAAIMTTFEAIVTAFNSSDVNRLMALHTDNFVLMDPGKPTMYGNSIGTAVFDRFKKEKTSLQLRYEIDELKVSGVMAFVRGQVFSRMFKGDATPVHDEGRFLCLFRKQPSGAWLRSHVMTNKVNTQPFV